MSATKQRLSNMRKKEWEDAIFDKDQVEQAAADGNILAQRVKKQSKS